MINEKLKQIFTGSDFQVYITNRFKHVPGNVMLQVFEPTGQVYCEWEKSKYFDDDYIAQNNYESPPKNFENACYDYLELNYPELYYELTKKD